MWVRVVGSDDGMEGGGCLWDGSWGCKCEVDHGASFMVVREVTL